MSADFREARYDEERRVLRFRVAVAELYAVGDKPVERKLKKGENSESDYAIQFNTVDVKLFHGMPVGETAISYVHSKIAGLHTMSQITLAQYESNANEHDT